MEAHWVADRTLLRARMRTQPDLDATGFGRGDPSVARLGQKVGQPTARGGT